MDVADGSNTKSGILAAAQLHSVTLQALAESVSKFMQTLDLTAAADNLRAEALVSAQKFQAACGAAQRQEAMVAEARAAAEKANVAQQVRRMHGWRAGPVCDRRSAAGRGMMWDTESNAGSETAPLTSSLGGLSVGGAQAAASAATIELERLQIEIAYLEATVSQESKLVRMVLWVLGGDASSVPVPILMCRY